MHLIAPPIHKRVSLASSSAGPAAMTLEAKKLRMTVRVVRMLVVCMVAEL